MKRCDTCGECRYCRIWQGCMICGRVMPITIVEERQEACYLSERKD